MEGYKNFSAADFALEDSFVQWVIHNDPKSQKIWNDWLENNPEKNVEVEIARNLVMALQFREYTVSQKEIQSEWEKQFRNSPSNLSLPERGMKRVPSLSYQHFSRIAATLLLVATTIFVVLKFAEKPSVIEEAPLTLVKETPKGQKLTIVLPDGTEIKLNSDSRIEYPSKFIGGTRAVILEGEAYFDVAHDTQKPFTVNTGDINTVVLGTSFNINAFPENDDVKISLLTGKVKVDAKSPSGHLIEVSLSPNEMISINKKGKNHQIIPFNDEEITGWKDGNLYFKKAGFEEIRLKLERWYGVTFEIKPQIHIDPDMRFNGEFRNKSLAYILDVFSYPDLFNFKIEERKVIIY